MSKYMRANYASNLPIMLFVNAAKFCLLCSILCSKIILMPQNFCTNAYVSQATPISAYSASAEYAEMGVACETTMHVALKEMQIIGRAKRAPHG